MPAVASKATKIIPAVTPKVRKITPVVQLSAKTRIPGAVLNIY